MSEKKTLKLLALYGDKPSMLIAEISIIFLFFNLSVRQIIYVDSNEIWNWWRKRRGNIIENIYMYTYVIWVKGSHFGLNKWNIVLFQIKYTKTLFSNFSYFFYFVFWMFFCSLIAWKRSEMNPEIKSPKDT